MTENPSTNNYAGFWIRLLAYLVDLFFITIIGYAISMALGRDPLDLTTEGAGLDQVVTYTAIALYYILFQVHYRGQTPGYKLTGIRLIKIDGKPVGYFSTIVRLLISILSYIPAALGYWWIIWDGKKQTWHDKVAKTYVVKSEQKVRIWLAITLAIATIIVHILSVSIAFTRMADLSNKSNSVEQYSESVDNYLNRPTYKNLTTEIIDSTPDEELPMLVIDNIWENIDEYTEEYDYVMSLSTEKRAIYIAFTVESEVFNGGLNQFYYNSSGRFAKEAPEAFRIIGADMIADVLEEANAVYVNNYDQITEEQDGSIEGFSDSYEDNPLEELDSKFFQLEDQIDTNQLMVNLIRKNPDNFIN